MRGSSAARFPYPRDQAGFLRCAPQVHRVVRHPVRRYDGSATAPPSVKGFGSRLLSTDARSCCLLGAPCRIRTLLTIRWISGKARAGEFLITLYASKRDWAQVAKDLKPVYTAASESEALDRFADFSGKWEKRYPAIIR